MQEKFGLQYETAKAVAGINATDSKRHYYTLNTRLEDLGCQAALISRKGIPLESEEILNFTLKNIVGRIC